ncbi:MAG TPA: methionine synthase [Jiangellaceae bacterium]
MEHPWGVGVATGVGSLPYDDRDEAAKVVVGELPDFAHLPELPARGAGADMVGRTAAMLVDMHVDLQPSGWRLVDRPGIDERRAVEMLRSDLDAIEIAAHGYEGPLKVQVCGPWTLAAALDRTRGDRVLADHGARRDLAHSLAEGLAGHLSDVARRVPGATVVAQVDEPGLPAVLAAAIPTSSGFGRLRAVTPVEAESLLAVVLAAAGEWPVLHCCAEDPPVALGRRAGALAVSLDVDRLDGTVLDQLAASVDDGLMLWPGIVPVVRPVAPPSDRDLADRLERMCGRLDQDPVLLSAGLVVTPACGLAGADPEWARRAYALARATARAFADSVGADQ